MTRVFFVKFGVCSDDIARMEVIEAYVGASGITGKDRVAERGAVNAWVRRSVAWSNGEKSNESGVGDPESRRTIAWSIVTETDHDGDGVCDNLGTGQGRQYRGGRNQ